MTTLAKERKKYRISEVKKLDGNFAYRVEKNLGLFVWWTEINEFDTFSEAEAYMNRRINRTVVSSKVVYGEKG